MDTAQPLSAVEIRALRKIQRDYFNSSYVFMTERKSPITDSTFRRIIARAGEKAKLEMPVHPHMFCGTQQVLSWLKNIQHTIHYTEILAGRFNEFWND